MIKAKKGRTRADFTFVWYNLRICCFYAFNEGWCKGTDKCFGGMQKYEMLCSKGCGVFDISYKLASFVG